MMDFLEQILTALGFKGIISRELFDESQKKMKARTRDPAKAILPHPFAGLFFCEACGVAMRQHMTANRKYVHFVCGTHHQIGKLACSSHYVNYNTLYQVVQEDIRRNAKLFSEDSEKAAKKLMELKCADNQKRTAQMNRELASAKKQLGELDMKLKRTYEDNISGKLPDHIFSMFIADYVRPRQSVSKFASI